MPYDGGVPFHPPGFPYLLAGVHAFIGAADPADAVPHLAVKAVMALIGSLPVGLLYLLARPYLGRSGALVAAGLSLYSFGLYVVAVAPVTEGLYLALWMTALLIWTRRCNHVLAADRGRSRSAWWGLLLGALLGLLALVRAEGLLIAGLLWAVGLGSALTSKRRRDRWQPWALMVLGLVVALTPWTLRNAEQLGRLNRRLGPQLAEPLPTFVPVSLYGPLNMALANHAGAAGGFSPTWRGSDGEELRLGGGALQLGDPGHLRLLLHGDRIAFDWIIAHPGAFGRLVLRKWGLALEALKLGWTQWNLPGGLNGLRRPVDLFVPHSRIGIWIMAPLILLGCAGALARPGPRRRWALLVLLMSLGLLLVVGLFFGYARAGVLMLPFWYSLIPAGLGPHLRLPSGAPGPRLRRALAGLALALLLLEAWGATADRTYQATGTMLPGRDYLNPDAVIYLDVDPETSAGWLPMGD